MPVLVVFERGGGLTSGDTKSIVPVVLIVIGLILALVLRALAAPGYLIFTVVASFAARLGLVTFAFTEVLGSNSSYRSAPPLPSASCSTPLSSAPC